VLVEVWAGGAGGLGYTYSNVAAAEVVRGLLRAQVIGLDAFDTARAWRAMVRAVRNQGVPGICAMALSAVDIALWDLKARLLGLPLAQLLGTARDEVPAYGSGGFTSYPVPRLQEQLAGWVEAGMAWVKMKVGRRPREDPGRVAAAREAIGDAGLMVDANGAYGFEEAARLGERFADLGVTWFEEPVPILDLTNLRLLRGRLPSGMELSAGEYGYELDYFRRLLEARAVDVLQADVTRCGGMTGFLAVSALCQAFGMQLSSHTAPALSVHPAVALQPVRHAEYFHDHARVENMLFEGVAQPVDGNLAPDTSRPGLGLELKRRDAGEYLVWGEA
jgi:L-alanine-DL-glutamate epimerase-like enolase superfamily enzyme